MSEQENKKEEAVAKLKSAQVTPKKSRKVVDMVRDLDSMGEIKAQLSLSPKKASGYVLKVLRSAIANAEHNHDMSPARLEISEIKVDEGPTLKRWMPRARGQADEIHKKTSHITVKLVEKEEREMDDYIIEEERKTGAPSGSESSDSDTPVKQKEISPDKNREGGGSMDQIFRRKSGM